MFETLESRQLCSANPLHVAGQGGVFVAAGDVTGDGRIDRTAPARPGGTATAAPQQPAPAASGIIAILIGL